jgi:hypothetical protein
VIAEGGGFRIALSRPVPFFYSFVQQCKIKVKLKK